MPRLLVWWTWLAIQHAVTPLRSLSSLYIVELLIYDPDGVVYNKLVDRVVVLHVGVNRKIHSCNSSRNNMGVNEALVVDQFKLLVCDETVVYGGFGDLESKIISSCVFIKACEFIYA